MPSQNAQGLISILLASFLFGFMAFLVKILSGTIPAAEILFVRAFVGILLFLFILFFGHKTFRINNRNMLVVRGLFGGVAVFLYFTAISRIPLSSATMLSNCYPFFAILFSAVLIKERPTFGSIMALLIAFGGMFLILDPHFEKLDIGYVLALTSALFGGVAVTSIRELRKTDSSWVIVFAQLLGAALFCLFPLSAGLRIPNIREWELLILIGVVGTAGQLTFTRPFKYVSASEGSVVALSTSVFVILFSVIFLKETLGSQFIFGSFMILGSSFYLIAREEGWLRIRGS
jgi:drug/metabolite transporter (DMT)-like permease